MRTRALDEVGERGGGLAEPHVVGEAAAEAEPGEELHPRQAAALVVAQLAVEACRPRATSSRRSSGSPARRSSTQPSVPSRRSSIACLEGAASSRAGRRRWSRPRCRSPAAAGRRRRATRARAGARSAGFAPGAARPGRCGPIDSRCAAAAPRPPRRGRARRRRSGCRRSPPTSRRAPRPRTAGAGRRPVPASRGRAPPPWRGPGVRVRAARCRGAPARAGAMSRKSSAAVEVELDPARLVLGGQIGEAGDVSAPRCWRGR